MTRRGPVALPACRPTGYGTPYPLPRRYAGGSLKKGDVWHAVGPQGWRVASGSLKTTLLLQTH